jgi:hypothetical protein
MRVAVIELDTGRILHTGESDGRRVDGFWLKVDGQMYNITNCYRAEDAEVVSARYREMAAEMKALKDAQQRRFMQTFKEFSPIPDPA